MATAAPSPSQNFADKAVAAMHRKRGPGNRTSAVADCGRKQASAHNQMRLSAGRSGNCSAPNPLPDPGLERDHAPGDAVKQVEMPPAVGIDDRRNQGMTDKDGKDALREGLPGPRLER